MHFEGHSNPEDTSPTILARTVGQPPSAPHAPSRPLLWKLILTAILLAGVATLCNITLIGAHITTPLSTLPAVFQCRAVPDLEHIPSPISQYIDTAIVNAFAAHIGMRDHGLMADGGRIFTALTSPSTHGHPDVVLRDNLHGGRCWAIDGTRGQVGIRLPHFIHPTQITIDHAPRQIAENVAWAPRRMRLWGVVEGEDNQKLYKQHTSTHVDSLPTGPPISHKNIFLSLATFSYDIDHPFYSQTFEIRGEVSDMGISFGVFVLEVLDNWGGDITCVYRVRIHGRSSHR